MAERAQTDAEKGAALLAEGNKWLERLRSAEKREDDWMKDAEAAEKAYSCDTKSKAEGKVYDFNILHSNVETIVPAIYNSTPVPDVRSRNTLPQVEEPQPPQPAQAQEGQQQPPPDPRAMMQFQQEMQRYQQAQQQIKAVKDFGTMIERAITVQIDDNKLDTEVESAAQDAFLSGRGIVRVRFHADFEDGDDNAQADGGEVQPGYGGGDGDAAAAPPAAAANERLTFEAVSWRDFRRGPAKRWEDLPWMAFRHSMPREEAERFSDKELLASQTGLDGEAIKDDPEEDDIIVWEIWCKEPDRYVKFVRESDGKIIKIEGDPLGLKDFFPVPRAVQPIVLTGNLRPVCPFAVYKKLADELDLITKRINKIMQGLKVRGLVAGDVSDVMNLAQADDNELVSATGLEGLAQTNGIDGAIMWWPIEQAIKVLKELYLQREQVKQSIYELTGISDIVRGASNAGETATAQQIKTQWGSLRIQKMQRLIQRLVRDLFIMSAEIITTKFSPQTLQLMTGIEITPLIQQLMAQKVLAHYRVDVESDSTVKADTTRIRTELGEFMQGTQAFFGAFAPIVQSSPEAAGPVATIYTAVANNFNLGKQVSESLDELGEIAKKAGKQPRPNPEAEKAKMEMEMQKAKLQGDMQMKQGEFQLKTESAKADMAMKQQDAQLDRQARMEELQIKREIAQIDREAKIIDLQFKREELGLKREELQMKAQAAQVQTAMGLQAKEAETSLKLDAQRQSNEMKTAQAKAKPAKK